MPLSSRFGILATDPPSPAERADAGRLRDVLAGRAHAGATVTVTAEGDAASAVTLSSGVATLLVEMLDQIERGNPVALVPIDRDLTTQQAADILNVSRPHLISLVEKGAIPHRRVGRHRRIAAADLLAYKERRDIVRDEALGTLAALDADLV